MLNRPSARFLSIALLHISTATGAYAQSGHDPDANGKADVSGGPGDIVVTAERRSSDLSRTPMSITAISGEQLEARGISGTADLQIATPGLVASQNFQGQFYIRGIGTDLQGVGTDPSVAIYIDGVYISRPNAAMQNFLDLNRVEVLRGPQGTLYGRNATGGVINIVTNHPNMESYSGDGRLEYGNYNSVLASATFNAPIDSGVLAIRGSFLTQHRDGYVRNLATGNRYDNIDVVTGRLQVAYTPSDRFDALLSADITRDGSRNYVVKPLDPHNSIAVALGGRVSPDPFKVYADTEGPLARNQGGVSATLHWNFDNFVLTSISSFRKLDSRRYLDTDGTDYPLESERGSPEHSTDYSQDLQLASVGDTTFSWLVGASYLHEEARASYNLYLFNDNQRVALPGRNTTDALAAFAQGSVELLSGFKVTAGVRYSYERKRETNSVVVDGVTVGTGGGRKSWNSATPKFRLEYQATPEILFYASATAGFKSGGFNSTGLQPPFNPEKIWSYEAGTKTTLLERRLQMSLAGFYYDYRDLQVNYISDVNGNPVTAIANAGKARNYGVEFQIDARPTRALNLNLAVSYLDAKFTRLMTADENMPGSPTVDLAGNFLPRAPKWSASASFVYRFFLPNASALELRADYKYQSKIYFSQFNYALEAQRAYGILNARVEYADASKKWSVYVFGQNVTNRTYLNNATRIASFGGVTMGLYAAPATYGGGVNFHF